MAVPVVVVGAEPAGLATSCELTKAEVEHVILERGRIGQTWRDRWDSFCLVTPNWSVQLPDGHYAGPDPDGFMLRDEVVGYLESYALSIEAPVHENVEVTGIEEGFVLRTSDGDFRAHAVVLATGAYQRPQPSGGRGDVAERVFQIDLDQYRNEGQLPDGASTVVPGLYFVGVHFLRKRNSSLLVGVGEDAALVARQISQAS